MSMINQSLTCYKRGDYSNFYNEDAEIVARICGLEIQFTKENRPHVAIPMYMDKECMPKLTAAGYWVVSEAK